MSDYLPPGLLTATLLAQLEAPDFVGPQAGGWICAAMGLLTTGMGLIYGIFWVWMLIDCLRREPDRFFWIWLLVIIPFPGAIVYSVMRFFPQSDVTAPKWMRNLLRGKELARLEAAAHQIGNPHQYIQWGEVLREVGQLNAARDAFNAALRKEPASLPALWGACQVAVLQHRPQDVKELAGRVLAIDPQYKFGDVSLAYGRALKDLGETAALREHLEKHVRRWRHPEAVYLLACRCRDDGDTAAAREQLQSMLRDIHGSPSAIARKFGRWRSLGRRMLRQLPP